MKDWLGKLELGLSKRDTFPINESQLFHVFPPCLLEDPASSTLTRIDKTPWILG
jgi:hypothetical protein